MYLRIILVLMFLFSFSSSVFTQEPVFRTEDQFDESRGVRMRDVEESVEPPTPVTVVGDSAKSEARTTENVKKRKSSYGFTFSSLAKQVLATKNLNEKVKSPTSNIQKKGSGRSFSDMAKTLK